MSTRIALAIIAGLAATPALAGPVSDPTTGGPLNPSNELTTALTNLRNQVGGEPGVSFMDDFPAAHPNSDQSMSLRMFGVGGGSGFVNSLGEVIVRMGTGFQNLGTNAAGKQILAQIRQFEDPTGRRFIEAEYKTADASALVPVGTTVAGQAVVAYGWEVGATDPIDWLSLWTSINIPANGATVTLFGPGGNSSLNHTPELVGPGGGLWNGVDKDNPAIALGDLFGRVLIRYEVQPIPAPAGLAALAAGLGLAAGRRRR